MPLYDVKCTVMRDGEPRTGKGVELPKDTGDRLVARKLATPSADALNAEPEQGQGQEGAPRFVPQHKGGGHYTVIDSETGEPAVEETMNKEGAQEKADALNAEPEQGQGQE